MTGGRFVHGLVIGKFYPPHAGHHLLVEAAADRCDRVTVVVLAGSEESISLDDRVGWLASTHRPRGNVTVVGELDDHPVDFDDPDIWSLHVGVMEAALARAAIGQGRRPDDAAVDAVFSSEPYGIELGRRFGAVPVTVDLSRTAQPISGTAVRADVVGNWEFLAAPVRAGLARRVVIVGAESSGTTTLARALADDLRDRGGVWSDTRWVAEYGRAFTEDKLAALTVHAARAGRAAPTMDDLRWTDGDFVHIAETQLAHEDAAAASGSPVLVCDTDAFATGIWYERYLGRHHRGVEAIGDARAHHLYLLTDHRGVEFEQDGIRDGEHVREWMTERFATELTATGRTWELVSGTPDERRAAARRRVDELVEGSWRFVDPKA